MREDNHQFHNNNNDNDNDNDNNNNNNNTNNGSNNITNENNMANNHYSNNLFGSLHTMDKNTIAQGGTRDISIYQRRGWRTSSRTGIL